MVIQFCPIDIQYETQLNLKSSRNQKEKQRELICNIFYLTYYSKYYFNVYFTLGFRGSSSGKEPACRCRRHKGSRFDPWAGNVPWRRKWQPTPVSSPGESHGWRSPESCSPRGRRVRHDWSHAARAHTLNRETTEIPSKICLKWLSNMMRFFIVSFQTPMCIFYLQHFSISSIATCV